LLELFVSELFSLGAIDEVHLAGFGVCPLSDGVLFTLVVIFVVEIFIFWFAFFGQIRLLNPSSFQLLSPWPWFFKITYKLVISRPRCLYINPVQSPLHPFLP